MNCCCCSVVKLCLTLWPHGLLHARPPCPSPSSCPLNWWCHSTISSSATHLILCYPLLFLPLIFSSIRIFSNELTLCIRWLKYWKFSFSISPSNEFSGLISLRIDWFNLFAVQGTLKSLLQHNSSKTSVLQISMLTVWAFLTQWCLCSLIRYLGLS